MVKLSFTSIRQTDGRYVDGHPNWSLVNATTFKELVLMTSYQKTTSYQSWFFIPSSIRMGIQDQNQCQTALHPICVSPICILDIRSTKSNNLTPKSKISGKKQIMQAKQVIQVSNLVISVKIGNFRSLCGAKNEENTIFDSQFKTSTVVWR